MSGEGTEWWCGATGRLFIDSGMAVRQGTKAKVVSEKKCFSSDWNPHFLLKCSTQAIKSFFFLEVSKHKNFWIAEMLLSIAKHYLIWVSALSSLKISYTKNISYTVFLLHLKFLPLGFLSFSHIFYKKKTIWKSSKIFGNNMYYNVLKNPIQKDLKQTVDLILESIYF